MALRAVRASECRQKSGPKTELSHSDSGELSGSQPRPARGSGEAAKRPAAKQRVVCRGDAEGLGGGLITGDCACRMQVTSDLDCSNFLEEAEAKA